MNQSLAAPPTVRKSRLAAYIENQLTSRIRDKGLVIWLDREGLYNDFVDQLPSSGFFAPVVAFRGSYLEVMLALDGKADGLDKPALLLHLPGHTPESVRTTPLLELYLAGTNFPKNFHTLVKEAAAGSVAPERILEDVDKLADFKAAEEWLRQQTEGGSDNPFERSGLAPEPLLCKLLEHPESILGRPLVAEDREALLDYWAVKTGLLPPIRQAIDLFRPNQLILPTVGWLLLMEYVNDLKRAPLGELAAIKEQAAFRLVCSHCLTRVRDSYPKIYSEVAQELENLPMLSLDLEAGSPEELGKVDTFSREDLRLLEESLKRLESGQWKDAEGWAGQRLKSQSLWVRSDPDRKHRWELVSACAAVVKLCQEQKSPLKSSQSLEDVVELYSSALNGVDRAHRVMEQLYDKLRFHPEHATFEGAIDGVRQAYYNWLDELNRSFNALCEAQGFLPPAHLQQRHIYEQVVHPLVQQQKKTAFFLIDALRFEMAVELTEMLQDGKVASRLKPRLAELPTITRVGMNALAPVARDGQLRLKKAFDGFLYDDYSVNSTARRVQAMGTRSLDPAKHNQKLPLHFTLKQLLAMPRQELAEQVEDHRMIVITSGEVDQAGEKDLGASNFEAILSKLESAVRVLHNCGVGHFVLTADHGFLMNNPKAIPINYDNGEVTRRYVLSAKTASVARDETVTVSLRQLAYEGSDQVLCLSRDSRTFQAPGQNAETFSHGGNSLQERVIPVLTLDFGERPKSSKAKVVKKATFVIEAGPDEVTPTMSRLRLTVREIFAGQQVLMEAGRREVRLAFSCPDAKASVQLLGASGAQVVNQQLIVVPGDEVENVVLLTTGSPATLEISHPTGDYLIESVLVALASPKAIVPQDWQATIEDEKVLKILQHLDKHGKISEEEIVKLLESPRAARRFANALEPLRPQLPFTVRVDTSNGTTTYIKE